MSLAPLSGILGVRALTRLVRSTLEGAFSSVWVRGEITGFRRVATSRHLYFSLREGDALIECVMFDTNARRVDFPVQDGLEVEAFGMISVYEQRGRYQLMIQDLRPAGLGALILRFEEIKTRLHAEGLFDLARKRPLPRFPRRIGLVTSPAGAAIQDMITVLRSRWPAIRIVLAPVKVQGAGAAEEIAAAIERFNRQPGVDLLIVGRGGGSFEDLWCFNEEIVVRAIAASRLPIVSAVGHEVDTTLADLAADVRAATPSNAAEIAVRNAVDIRHRVEQQSARLERGVRQHLAERRHRLGRITSKYGFRRLRDALGPSRQRIDELVERTIQRARDLVSSGRTRLDLARSRYGLREFPRRVRGLHESVDERRVAMIEAARQGIAERRVRRQALEERLRALSPRAILERGYCLARAADGTLLRTATEVSVGDALTVEFARGLVEARAEVVREEDTWR